MQFQGSQFWCLTASNHPNQMISIRTRQELCWRSWNNEETGMDCAFVHEPMQPAEGLDHEETNLMENAKVARNVCTLADLKHWLESILPAYRRGVIAKLLESMKTRRAGLQQCIQYLETQQDHEDAYTQVEDDFRPHYAHVAVEQFLRDLRLTDEESQPALPGEGLPSIPDEGERQLQAPRPCAMTSLQLQEPEYKPWWTSSAKGFGLWSWKGMSTTTSSTRF